MAIYTPRGLKIRLNVPYAFALMARLFPKVDAFHVLQLTEEVENLASAATAVVTAGVFVARLDPLTIGVATGTTWFAFKLSHLLGLFIPPFKTFLPLSRIFSWFAGYGIFFVLLVVLGLFTVGWQGVLAFIVARLTALWLAGLLDFIYGRFVFKKTGVSVTASERSFFHAYRLSADKVGASRSLDVSEDEMEPENWQPTYADLMLKWPVVVSRFTPD
ncbi:MAG: hypothetical protein JXB13_04465 [Phycisphaerae bacterium]|nr:hypothetical protein [Phycisphaerae bacterium]